ncbi:MAG: ribosome biogenesis GTPase Der [Betaproteobacteria bacterium]|jgi:GTP-binding protein|nr:ribosome biogenesis GTPase Der [Betaproteobacteria bacterium]
MPEALQRWPVVAIVGRPNVGKSTLFNRLTRSRDALVADLPGLTRDRQYGRGRLGSENYIVIDTGGFEPVAKDGIAAEMARQARLAIVEADIVLFIVDGRQGLAPRDLEIAAELRRTAGKLVLAVNKCEGMRPDHVLADFQELGFARMFAVSAAHGDGVRSLLDSLFEEELRRFSKAFVLPVDELRDLAGEDVDVGKEVEKERTQQPMRVAIVGRPNAGKSTLINALLGEERVIAFDQPGTTRDALSIDFKHLGRDYTLVDTAGLRKRGKVHEAVEKFSVVKTLQAIEQSHVCILMLDAGEGVGHLDAGIANYVLDAGRAVVVAVNKWDALDSSAKQTFKRDLLQSLQFLQFAELCFISAKQARGLAMLMRAVDQAFAAAMAKLPTPKLTRALREAVERQQPPRKGPFRPKLRYAHQGGQNPPVVVVHGNSLDRISESYKRYLESWFRNVFKLQGTPLRIEWRSSTNPYAKED